MKANHRRRVQVDFWHQPVDAPVIIITALVAFLSVWMFLYRFYPSNAFAEDNQVPAADDRQPLSTPAALRPEREGETGTPPEVGGEVVGRERELEIESGLHIGTDSARNLQLIQQNTTQTQTHFPLSVNATTGALTVTTPSGVKTVTILPDAAVQNLIQNHVVTRVDSSPTSPSAQLVILTQLGNTLAYQVRGSVTKHFLGFVPVAISQTVYVSPQTGTIIRIEQPFFSQVLSLLSF